MARKFPPTATKAAMQAGAKPPKGPGPMGTTGKGWAFRVGAEDDAIDPKTGQPLWKNTRKQNRSR